MYGSRTMSPTPADQHRALYRRWRAQRFAEVLGQDPIVATLRRAVAADRTAHAYLFVGPRGTGKTSTARILAKAINCTNRGDDGEPCDTCPACVAVREGRAMDVIEIDAASHGLVEDARELVMRALTAPAELRRRVYIIDEVHMLSAHAFNALLKMVEEPPDHVVFILATTDTHKVPATIISRTQRFDFRPIPADAIVGKLTRIVAAEGAEAEPEALALIARLADGGMRDAESLLDQVLAYAGDQVTLEAVREAVGLADDAAISRPADCLRGRRRAGRPGPDRSAGRWRPRHGPGGVPGRGRGAPAAAAVRRRPSRRPAPGHHPAHPGRGGRGRRARGPRPAGDGAAGGRTGIPDALPAGAARPAPVQPAVADTQPVTTPPQAPNLPRACSEPVAAAASVTVRACEPAAEPAAAEPAVAVAEPAASPAAASTAPPPDGVAGIRARWADVVASASPALRPLLTECRPVALDGARLTLAFPEERGFMREKVTNRAGSIEQLLTTVLGGSWAVDCIASNVELEPLTVQQAVASRSRRSGRPGPAGRRPAHHRGRAGRRAGGPLISFRNHAAHAAVGGLRIR